MTVVINGTSGITDVNGTAAAPAITGTDTDTGVFFGTNTVSLSTGGTERLQVDSSGNLGLGVTPSAWSGSGLTALQVRGMGLMASSTQTWAFANAYFDGTNTRYINNGSSTYYRQNSSGDHIWYIAPSGTAGNAITFTQAMTLDASGNLGVGTTSPNTRLHLNTSGSSIGLTLQCSGGYGYVFNDGTYVSLASDNGATGLKFLVSRSAPDNAATIDSSGCLLVGTTSKVGVPQIMTVASNTTAGMHINGSSVSVNYGMTFYYNSGMTGQVSWNTTTTTYATSSDYRLKENIAPMTGALAKVAALKPCTYTWKLNGEVGEGFIAHELAEVVPDAVTGEKDGTRIEQYEISPAVPAIFDDEGNELTPAVEAVMGEREVPVYQGIDTSFLVATLTAAIQEQQAIITQLQADVAALKGNA